MQLSSDAEAPPPGATAVFTTDRELVVLSWTGWLNDVVPGAQAVGRALGELVPDLEERGLGERLRGVLGDGRPLVLAAAFHHHLIPCPPRSPAPGVTHMRQHAVVSPIRAGETVVGLTVVLRDVTPRDERSRRLVEALASDDPAERSRAQQELAGRRVDPESLTPALSDTRWRVRRRASQAFAMAGAEATAALLRVVREGHTDPAALNAAIDALAMQGDAAVPGLIELLDDRSPDVRVYASLALGLVGHPDAVTALLQALGDPDPNVRYHAVEALGRLHALDAGPALMTIAEGDDDFLAFAALEAIAHLGDGSLAPRVAALLQREELAAPAVRALGGVGGPEQVQELTRRLADADPGAADVAAALARIAARSAPGRVARLVREAYGPAQLGGLKRALERSNPGEVAAVAEVLGWLPDESAAVALVSALDRPEAEDAAARALVARRGDAVAALLGRLESDDASARTRAAVLLGRLGSTDAVEALVALLDPGEPAALAAAAALGEIADERAFEPLLALLDVESATLRRAAVGALNSMGHPDLARRATELLAHPSPRVRESAAGIVGYFGHRAAASRFLALLGDEHEGVRCAAAEHLSAFEGPEANAALARALADPAPTVRAAACRSLAQSESDAAPALVLRALDDENLWVRYAAARAAAWHGVPELRERLERTAQQDAPPVRAAAFESLAALRSPRLGELARAALGEPEPDVAVAAVQALVASGTPLTNDVLTLALAAPEARVRAAAAAALRAHAADPDAAPARERALRDPDAGVVRAALQALVSSSTPEGVEAAVALLADERSAGLACEALASVDGDGVDGLAHALGHPDAFVRLSVVECLRDARGDGVTGALARALEDDVAAVRVAARRALEAHDLRDLERRRAPWAPRSERDVG